MKETVSRWWPGVPLAVGSAALFGASTPFAKPMLTSVDPWLMAGVLYLGAGVGLWLVRQFARAAGRRPTEAPLRRADLPWLAAATVLGGIVGPLLLMFGLARIEASSAALLLNMEGLATLAIAWIVFRESISPRLVLGAMAILAGAALLSWKGDGVAFQPGAFLILAACVAWGLDNNLTRRLAAADPMQIATIKGLTAGATNVGLAGLGGAPMPSILDVAIAGGIGFFGYGISLVWFVLGLRYLGVARATAYFAIAPFIGAVLAVLLFDEPLSSKLLAAGALMAAGLWLHLTEHHEHKHAHERLEHEHMHVHDEHHRHEHEPDHPSGARHSHRHAHVRLVHRHPHYPDIHHRHMH